MVFGGVEVLNAWLQCYLYFKDFNLIDYRSRGIKMMLRGLFLFMAGIYISIWNKVYKKKFVIQYCNRGGVN